METVVRDAPALTAPIDTQDVLRTILRGRSPYDVRVSGVSLAPYQFEKRGLLDSVREGPELVDLLPKKAREYLDGAP